jgi:hypothetical protein
VCRKVKHAGAVTLSGMEFLSSMAGPTTHKLKELSKKPIGSSKLDYLCANKRLDVLQLNGSGFCPKLLFV